MTLFENIRRANVDFYTASPLQFLSEADLTALAESNGMSLEELKAEMDKPHSEMTCPLCGRPSTHVVSCKGCGGGSWGYEYEEAHGEDVIERLRDGLAVTLHTQSQAVGLGLTNEQTSYAVKHAYQYSGCLICPDCWHHTLPSDAFWTCPLYLHAERITAHSPGTPRVPFHALLAALLNGEKADAWLKRVFLHWCEVWNTVPEKQAVAAWRSAILHGALGTPDEFLAQEHSVETEIAELFTHFGLKE